MPVTAADLAPNVVRRWAAETPDVTFLRHVDGRTATYAETDRALDRWAALLRARGIRPGARVASFITDPFDAATLWLAIGRAGCVAVPLNTAHVGQMLRHVLRTADPALVIASPDLAERVADGPDVLVLGDVALPVDATFEPADPEPHDTAMLLFTSGTTGPSKAVVVPWAGAHGYWSWVPADTLQPGEALYAPMTMFHISGLGALQFAAWRGGCLVVRDRFSGQAFWDDVRSTGAVAAGLVGPMTALLAAAQPQGDDADNPLRGMILGPMIPEMAAFQRRFAVEVATCYGMTEVPPMIATGWDHGPWQTCGRIVDGAEARIVDEHDQELPTGEVGELVVRTSEPWTLNGGYFRDAETTVAAWRNGWFHTGDAFRCDEDGWFYFVDRMRDTIRRRGENISSFEVEAAVLALPGVGACAAFGVPDTYGGHEVMVAVVPVPGAELDPAALGAALGESLPKFMAPRYVDVVPELPRNTTSLRVQKFVLRDRGVTPTTWDRASPDRDR